MLALLLLVAPPAFAGEEGALAAIPFGVAHFMWGKPVRGLVYAGTQAVGITGATLGTVMATESLEADDDDAIADWQIVAGSSVALASASYVIQAIDGSRLAEVRQAAQARRDVQLFDRGVAAAAPYSVRVGDSALAVVHPFPSLILGETAATHAEPR